MLTTRFRRAVERDRCVLVTVTGPAGMGKSRILKEFVAGIEDEATVVVGRCLPYGEGITYWPLIEIVNDLAGVTGTPEIEGLLAGDSQPQVVASRVAAAAGRGRGERDRGWTSSGPCAGCSRRSHAAARSWPRSTTSTGPSRRCST